MALRPRHYYPKSQITEGLYTPGKEWMLLDNTEYVGLYHKYADGTIMTQSTYNEKKSEYLIPFREIKNESSFIYDNITTAQDLVKSYNAPMHYRPKLTDNDIKQGYVIRYFIRRRNDSRSPIYEVPAADYKTLMEKNKGLNGNLYYGVELKWKITGPEFDVKDSKGNITQFGVRDTNKRTVQSKDILMPGLSTFLGELVELSQYQQITKLQ